MVSSAESDVIRRPRCVEVEELQIADRCILLIKLKSHSPLCPVPASINQCSWQQKISQHNHALWVLQGTGLPKWCLPLWTKLTLCSEHSCRPSLTISFNWSRQLDFTSKMNCEKPVWPHIAVSNLPLTSTRRDATCHLPTVESYGDTVWNAFGWLLRFWWEFSMIFLQMNIALYSWKITHICWYRWVRHTPPFYIPFQRSLLHRVDLLSWIVPVTVPVESAKKPVWSWVQKHKTT